MELPSTPTVCFDELTNLFVRKSNSTLSLESSFGEGRVHIHNLADGLQARLWNCNFKQEFQLAGDGQHSIDPSYFTLAFFLDTRGFRFAKKDAYLPGNIVWNTVFLSDRSNCKIHFTPGSKAQCLSISFSGKWLNKNFFEKTDAALKTNKKIFNSESFSLVGWMSASEKKLVSELLNASHEESLSSFYIKCCVLKVISDFLLKLKERRNFEVKDINWDTVVTNVQEYLMSQLLAPAPKLKDLQNRYSVSGSSLNRHFKRKFGVNISFYLNQKKMEHAKILIFEKHMAISQTASVLGYRDERSFIKCYKTVYGEHSLDGII